MVHLGDQPGHRIGCSHRDVAHPEPAHFLQCRPRSGDHRQAERGAFRDGVAPAFPGRGEQHGVGSRVEVGLAEGTARIEDVAATSRQWIRAAPGKPVNDPAIPLAGDRVGKLRGCTDLLSWIRGRRVEQNKVTGGDAGRAPGEGSITPEQSGQVQGIEQHARLDTAPYLQLFAQVSADRDVPGAARGDRESGVRAADGDVVPVRVVVAHQHPHPGRLECGDQAHDVVSGGGQRRNVVEYRVATGPASRFDHRRDFGLGQRWRCQQLARGPHGKP